MQETADEHIIRLQQANAHLVAASMESPEPAEQAQRISDQNYRTLFESIDEGFCIIEKMNDEVGNALDFRFIKNADAAMYQAKAFGRNNYQFFRQTPTSPIMD